MYTRGEKPGCSLGELFIKAARRNRRKRCICDSTGRRLNYGRILSTAIALREKLKPVTAAHEMVGIMLPASVGGVLANLTVTLLGNIPVNLNYTMSEKQINSAIEQCGIKLVISSHAFAERLANFDNLPKTIFLEDIGAGINLLAKIKAYLLARFMPRRLLAKTKANCGDKTAAVIFSSGSSGEPKGVMLSHNNIFSNIDAIRKVLFFTPNDNLCATLPFFHAFGLTCGLWLPLVCEVSAGYAINPLDGKAVGKVARESRSTILFSTSTFLSNYVRRTDTGDFAGLRLVVAGGEKLRKSLADSFEAKFAIKPLEGYGATELSPVVSLNLKAEQGTGLHKTGHREGTVGLPLPAVELKIVSADTGEELPRGEKGLLLVKGPNVMLGYLNKEEETAAVIRDGWYNTGDMAGIDEDGLLTIEGRLSRFSKIGGEMVPHAAIEEVYLRSLNTNEQVVAVTGVPDDRKGEELVVLYVDEAADADQLHEIICRSELPNIWKPSRKNYIRIDSMPTLGSGKLDVMKLHKIALVAKNHTLGR